MLIAYFFLTNPKVESSLNPEFVKSYKILVKKQINHLVTCHRLTVLEIFKCKIQIFEIGQCGQILETFPDYFVNFDE